jgi:guanylate kinase
VKRRGVPFVVSAPSGTGKTTVCRELVARDSGLVFSVSHTTRPPRPGERDGRDYHFVAGAEFDRLVASGAFLEWARYSGHAYGTALASLEAELEAGRDVLLEIETQGARQVRERRPDAFSIFLLPPTLAALETRLRGRGTDDEGEIRRRLEIARSEFREAPHFDAVVINDELDATVRDVGGLIAQVRAGDVARARTLRAWSAVRSQLGSELVEWVAA